MNAQTAEKVKEIRAQIQNSKKSINGLAQDTSLDTSSRNELDRAYGRLADAEALLERVSGETAEKTKAHTA